MRWFGGFARTRRRGLKAGSWLFATTARWGHRALPAARRRFIAARDGRSWGYRVTTDGKRLYGAVSVTDLLAAIEAQRGVKIERGQFSIEDSLREVGEYEATIDLGHGVNVKVKITILDEQAPEA